MSKLALLPDYIFYRIVLAYRSWGEWIAPQVYAIGIISISEGLLIFGIIYLFLKLSNLDIHPPYIISLSGQAGILLVNFFYTFRPSRARAVLLDWENRESHVHDKMKLLAILYFAVVLLLVVAAIALPWQF